MLEKGLADNWKGHYSGLFKVNASRIYDHQKLHQPSQNYMLYCSLVPSADISYAEYTVYMDMNVFGKKVCSQVVGFLYIFIHKYTIQKNLPDSNSSAERNYLYAAFCLNWWKVKTTVGITVYFFLLFLDI
jgi:hypothetical protein